MRSVIVAFLIGTGSVLAVDTAYGAPSREQTLDYINALFGQVNNVHVTSKSIPGLGYLKFFSVRPSAYLQYDKKAKVYTTRSGLRSEDLAGQDFGVSGKVYMDTDFWTVNLPIKRIVKFENEEEPAAAGVSSFCVEFDVSFQVYRRVTAYRNSGQVIDRGDKIVEQVSRSCTYYPSLDQDNFRRLQNAFLRLKEIESEEVDLFLD